MLIKLNSETWINGDNVNRIDIKQDDQLEDEGFIRYYVVIDTYAKDYYLGDFQTFEDAESFVLDMVGKLNAEARHET